MVLRMVANPFKVTQNPGFRRLNLEPNLCAWRPKMSLKLKKCRASSF